MMKLLALLWLFAASSNATPGRVVKNPLDPGMYLLSSPTEKFSTLLYGLQRHSPPISQFCMQAWKP